MKEEKSLSWGGKGGLKAEMSWGESGMVSMYGERENKTDLQCPESQVLEASLSAA